MVEDRITDGKRIAQLLASELTAPERGPLAHVAVADADPDAEAASGGTRGYAVSYRDEVIGAVWLFPETAALGLRPGRGAVVAAAEEEGLERVDSPGDGSGGPAIGIESGADVKRAVDALVVGLGD